MHSNPYADALISKRVYPAQQFKRGEAGHNGVQVVGHRRTEYSEDSVTHFSVNDATVLMHGQSHFFQRRREPCDRVF